MAVSLGDLIKTLQNNPPAQGSYHSGNASLGNESRKRICSRHSSPELDVKPERTQHVSDLCQIAPACPETSGTLVHAGGGMGNLSSSWWQFYQILFLTQSPSFLVQHLEHSIIRLELPFFSTYSSALFLGIHVPLETMITYADITRLISSTQKESSSFHKPFPVLIPLPLQRLQTLKLSSFYSEFSFFYFMSGTAQALLHVTIIMLPLLCETKKEAKRS